MHTTFGITAVDATAATCVVEILVAGVVSGATVRAVVAADVVYDVVVVGAAARGAVLASSFVGESSPSEMSPMIPMRTISPATAAAMTTPRRILGGFGGSGGGAIAARTSPARNA